MGTGYEDIPQRVVAYSKELMLDAIGCALAGSVTPTGKIIIDVTAQMGSAGESGIIGGGIRTSAADAALANGTLCHCMDYDDMGFHGHPSGTIVPVLLALGEKLNRSGREIMEAHAVGFEVFGKIGEHSHELYLRGWHSTPILGVLGATAAAARLLKLDVRHTQNALGIAASQIGGMQANFGTMTKSLHSGHAARTAILSAMLARNGFTGQPEILEHPQGFAFTFVGSDNIDVEKAVADLGRPFRMEYWPPGIKKYDCCGGNHNALDAILELIRKHDIRYENVDNVQVDVDGRVTDILIFPDPQTGHESRFSLHYNMAAAILDGKLDRTTHTDERVVRPDIREAMKKVTVVVHPEWPKDYRGRHHPVTITLKDGRSFTHMTEKVKGSALDPLSREDLMTKYADCAGEVLQERDVVRSAELVLQMEELPDISELMNILTKEGKSS